MGGNSYLAQLTVAPGHPEGTVPFEITFRDHIGNEGTPVSATTTGGIVIIDRTAPTITGVHIAANNAVPGYATTGNVLTLTFTANEALRTPQVTLAEQPASLTHLGAN